MKRPTLPLRRSGAILTLAAALTVLAAAPSAAQSGAGALERYIEAVGGAGPIGAVESFAVRGRYGFTSPFALEGTIELYFARPGNLLFRVDLPGYGTMLRGASHGVAWGLDPQNGPRILEGEEADAARRWVARGFSLLPATEVFSHIGDIERVEWEGAPADRVSLVVAGTDTEYQEYFNPATGLLVGRTEGTAGGELLGWASEFERHGPLLVATRWRHRLGSQDWWAKYESVEFDAVDPAVFEPPLEVQALLERRSRESP